MDSFVSVNFLFEVINFKNVWDTTDNTRRCKNGHFRQKVSQPSAAALGFQSFVLYRLMMVRRKMREFFCTDLLCFPSYISLQIYCAFPSTFLYRFTVLSHPPFCTDLGCFPSYLSVQIYCAFPSAFLYRFTVLFHLPFCMDLMCLPIYLSVQIYCAFPSTFLYRFRVLSHPPFCTDLLCFPIPFLYRFSVLSHLPFCTGLLWFPSYLSVQIYCAFPPTYLYIFAVLPQLCFCVLSFLKLCSIPIPISTRILTLFNKGKPFYCQYYFASPVVHRLTENERNSVGRWSSSNTSNHLHVAHHGVFIMEVMVAYRPQMGPIQRTAAWLCLWQEHRLLHHHHLKVQLVLQLPMTASSTMTLLNQQLYQMMLMHWGYFCKR